ncbi:MAG: enoyl-CoA hydratase/isomerase family protein [Ectothiorhodospiraceae bacterium]|nr:enoyl-CoA hydratase/isomerase family protein [Ectothiorhodospiraceae bacterium]
MASTKYKHWQLKADSDNIAWLHFDKADSGTNTLGREVIDELSAVLDDMETERPRGLVILSDKPNGFIAGADIHEFARIENIDQAREVIRRGQGVINRIARFRFPTVALIHGFCLGGGYELALGCDYRIADDDVTTKIGLPEVRLGIHPGFGGVARLPQLIGAPAAMNLMLSGRAVSARAAKKIGMIDYAVPRRHLHEAACSLIQKPPKKLTASGWKAATNHALIRPLLARYLRKQVAKKAAKEHYPAPYAMIDLWAKHSGDSSAMLYGEEVSLARLVVGETAQNLIRVFLLQEKLKSLGDKKQFVPKRVHVIGGGVMGGDIAAWCALRGMQVTVQDREEATLARVIERAAKLYKKKLKKPRLVQEVLDRLTPDINGLGVAQADVVIEAIFEDIDAKQALYREVEPKMKAGALLATNTSSIPLDTLSDCLSDPSRLVGIHFFNPVAMMQLVEIVTAENTSPEVAAKAAAFTRHIDRLPLPVTSTPGFLVNRVLMPYLLEAVVIESEGISAKAIDQVALDFGMPMGPIALADTVGLDICLAVAETLSRTLYKDTKVEVPARLRALVESGKLGKKSGQGFYHYPANKKSKAEASNPGKGEYRPADIQDRLMMRMINEARACLREGVVSDAELLDAGIIFGTGFAPFRGGPMHYIEAQGVEQLIKKMHHLHESHGERFNPDESWLSTT